MSVICAFIFDRRKTGTLLLSRQFVSISPSRLDVILTAFPKLLPLHQQSSCIETPELAYHFQNVSTEVLIGCITTTTPIHNQVADLLRLIASCASKICEVPATELTAHIISAFSYDIIWALDEVVQDGYIDINTTTMEQVDTCLTMDSHEEYRWRVQQREKLHEAKKKGKQKARELDAKRAAAADGLEGGMPQSYVDPALEGRIVGMGGGGKSSWSSSNVEASSYAAESASASSSFASPEHTSTYHNHDDSGRPTPEQAQTPTPVQKAALPSFDTTAPGASGNSTSGKKAPGFGAAQSAAAVGGGGSGKKPLLGRAGGAGRMTLGRKNKGTSQDVLLREKESELVAAVGGQPPQPQTTQQSQPQQQSQQPSQQQPQPQSQPQSQAPAAQPKQQSPVTSALTYLLPSRPLTQPEFHLDERVTFVLEAEGSVRSLTLQGKLVCLIPPPPTSAPPARYGIQFDPNCYLLQQPALFKSQTRAGFDKAVWAEQSVIAPIATTPGTTQLFTFGRENPNTILQWRMQSQNAEIIASLVPFTISIWASPNSATSLSTTLTWTRTAFQCPFHRILLAVPCPVAPTMTSASSSWKYNASSQSLIINLGDLSQQPEFASGEFVFDIDFPADYLQSRGVMEPDQSLLLPMQIKCIVNPTAEPNSGDDDVTTSNLTYSGLSVCNVIDLYTNESVPMITQAHVTVAQANVE